MYKFITHANIWVNTEQPGFYILRSQPGYEKESSEYKRVYVLGEAHTLKLGKLSFELFR